MSSHIDKNLKRFLCFCSESLRRGFDWAFFLFRKIWVCIYVCVKLLSQNIWLLMLYQPMKQNRWKVLHKTILSAAGCLLPVGVGGQKRGVQGLGEGPSTQTMILPPPPHPYTFLLCPALWHWAMRPTLTLQQLANVHLTASLAATGRKIQETNRTPAAGRQFWVLCCSPGGLPITTRSCSQHNPQTAMLFSTPSSPPPPPRPSHLRHNKCLQQRRHDLHPWPISNLRVLAPPRRSAPVLFTTLTLHRRVLGGRITQPNRLAPTPLPLLTAHPGGWGRGRGDYRGVGQVDRCLNAAWVGGAELLAGGQVCLSEGNVEMRSAVGASSAEAAESGNDKRDSGVQQEPVSRGGSSFSAWIVHLEGQEVKNVQFTLIRSALVVDSLKCK